MTKKLPKKLLEVKNSKVQEDPKKNLHVSYSQLFTYHSCPHQWEEMYLRKNIPYTPSIHTVFGTAFHTTVQKWLEVMYEESGKEASKINLHLLLYNNMMETYKKEYKKNKNVHFTAKEDLEQFYEDGIEILDYLRKKRGVYFSLKKMELVGIETPLYEEIRPGVVFKGFIDVLFYDKQDDQWIIVDIKTSTKGWGQIVKTDDLKKSQILLYREYFSKKFDIPLEKIDVLFFIVKRKIPLDAEFASMKKRVQEYKPPSGTSKMNKARKLVDVFLEEAVNEKGNYIDKAYKTTPSKNACKFCYLKKNRLCPDAFL